VRGVGQGPEPDAPAATRISGAVRSKTGWMRSVRSTVPGPAQGSVGLFATSSLASLALMRRGDVATYSLVGVGIALNASEPR